MVGVLLRALLGMAAICLVFLSEPAYADDSIQFTRNGMEYRSAHDKVRITLGGRLHLDAAAIDDGGLQTEDEEVRRARLELTVRMFDKWRLRIDREFTNDGGWRNVWLRYEVNERFNVKVGNFIAPFSMEDVGSSNDIMFMERSLAQALAPGFGVGIAGAYEGRHFSVAGGYFGDAIDAEDNIQAEKGQGVAIRATWSPVEQRDRTLHLGLGLERREFDSGDLRRISSGPEASLGHAVVTTGSLANLETSQSYNVEAAYSHGPLLIQSQFMSTSIERSPGGDLRFDGYYVQAGWIVTGERHGYGDGVGVFAGPEPRSRWGAVEIAARVSSLDLAEAGAAGGQADDITGGVNWYVGRNVRLMANYVHSEVDAVNPLLDRDVDVWQARAQLSF